MAETIISVILLVVLGILSVASAFIRKGPYVTE